MTWRQLLTQCEDLQEYLERMPGDDSNFAHYARMRLMNALARAQEILEAFT